MGYTYGLYFERLMKEVVEMKLREIEKTFEALPDDELVKLIDSLAICIQILPETLVQELCLRTLLGLASIEKTNRAKREEEKING